MTKKDARCCVRRTVVIYTVTNEVNGECIEYTKLPPEKKLAKSFPEGYSVKIEKNMYALPLEKFLQYAEVIE